MGMKLMAALATVVFSTGFAWGAETPVGTPVEKESAPAQKAPSVKKERSPAQKAQQEKMKSCNTEAREKGLKGDERKKFMSGCLKGSTKAS